MSKYINKLRKIKNANNIDRLTATIGRIFVFIIGKRLSPFPMKKLLVVVFLFKKQPTIDIQFTQWGVDKSKLTIHFLNI